MIGRRAFLSIPVLCAWTSLRAWQSTPASTKLTPERRARILRIVGEYSDQGFHRTGTAVDRASAEWLAGEVRQTGLTAALDPFPFERVDPVTAVLHAGERRIEGLPFFDGTFTDRDGVRGSLKPLADKSTIGLAQSLPDSPITEGFAAARREKRHQAIVLIARGARPSDAPCVSNAPEFEQPFGPPVLQVGGTHRQWLEQLAEQGAEVQVVAHVQRTSGAAFNVTATLPGRDRSLPPLVIMTPRSGWYSCASERGGGIVCWLELMRRLHANRPRRDVHFVATSGHELGHLGLRAYVRTRAGLFARSVGWIHLGANLGAAVAKTGPGEGNMTQASDHEMEKLLLTALETNGIPVHLRRPVGSVAGGEAELVHKGGGRYVSAIGRNALFHHIDDRGADVVDPAAIAGFADAFAGVAETLVAS